MKMMRKVPEITFYFWIIKLLSTALGESVSDYLVHQINPVVAVIIGAIGFVFAMGIQLSVRRYIPWAYWLAVTMVAIFGTMAADVIHIVLGVPYIISAVFLMLALAATFAVWYGTEKDLSIHSITSLRREIFYWAAVVVTFALGTATGDLTAITFHLGYAGSALLFAILFILPFIAGWKFGLGEVVSFWFAYIMTRPLGASIADWFGKSQQAGGIGFGSGQASLVLTILTIGFVVYLTFSQPVETS